MCGQAGVFGAFLLPCLPAHEPLRLHVRAHGVEGGYWYGNSQLFLPAHQDLSDADVGAIVDIIRASLKEKNLPPITMPQER